MLEVLVFCWGTHILLKSDALAWKVIEACIFLCFVTFVLNFLTSKLFPLIPAEVIH